MSVAFVFPGQGSQSVGMGKALTDNFTPARHVFEEVDDALGEKLSATIWEGPADKLTLTENAQPALMAVSLAVVRVLEAEADLDLKKEARFVAGHSLGEYSALAAAGAFSLSDAARLLRTRGRAMQQAVPVGTGAMAAVRSSYPATRPPWSAPWKWPRRKARGGRYCCRFPPRSIVRSCSRPPKSWPRN